MNDLFELEIPPDEPPSGDSKLRLLLADGPPPPEEEPLPLARALPGLPLQTLLSFLPDVSLKQQVEALAAVALSIDVQQPGGLQLADKALDDLSTAILTTTSRFADPVDAAFQLHRRLTGLRGDFLAAGESAKQIVSRRIVAEKRRQDAVAAEERRKRQEEADRQAREIARKAAEEAERQKAPEPIVQALVEQSKTAKAPPVAVDTPVTSHNAVVEKWRCRLKGAAADADPNPDMGQLTLAQQQQVRTLLRAVADGHVPLLAVKLNWSYLNTRARDEKSTFDLPELEAYDEGGTRRKGAK